jgi:hypothetical protein
VRGGSIAGGATADSGVVSWHADAHWTVRGRHRFDLPLERLAAGDCLMGVQLGFMGVNSAARVIWAGSRAAAAVRELPAAAGGCHHACQMVERRDADDAGRFWPAARFGLTAVIVSAGQVLVLVMRSGCGAAIRLRNAGLGGLCRVSLDW